VRHIVAMIKLVAKRVLWDIVWVGSGRRTSGRNGRTKGKTMKFKVPVAIVVHPLGVWQFYNDLDVEEFVWDDLGVYDLNDEGVLKSRTSIIWL
jgi:hypothetical protein